MALPVLGTIVEAFGMARRYEQRLALLAVMAVALGGINRYVLAIEAGSGAGVRLAVVMGVSFAATVLVLPFITSAHRLVLQGDGASTGWIFRREEWIYLLAGLRLFPRIVLCGAVLTLAWTAAVVSVGANNGAIFQLATVLLPLIMMPAMLIYVAGFLMILPAAAIGRKLLLRESVALLKGNRLRLSAMLALLWCPVLLANLSLDWLARDLILFDCAVSGLLSALSTGLFALTLSLTYRQLGGMTGAPDPAAAA